MRCDAVPAIKANENGSTSKQSHQRCRQNAAQELPAAIGAFQTVNSLQQWFIHGRSLGFKRRGRRERGEGKSIKRISCLCIYYAISAFSAF